MNIYCLLLIFLQLFLLPNECLSKNNPCKKAKKQAPHKLIQNVNDLENIFPFQNIQDWIDLDPSSEMKRYYSETDLLGGWFDKRLIVIMFYLDQFQSKNGITGNLGEIGVWYGKSFIPLMHLAKNGEYVAAIDCFESYEFNRDNSGGFLNPEFFTNNITKYCSQPDKLITIKGDSVAFSSKDYLDAMNNQKRFRMFSIDGCHEAEPTRIDMTNAFNSLADGGIVIMDDYFHCGWPGVSEGVNSFMSKNVNALKPFLIGLNKIFLASPEYAKQYFDAIKGIFRTQDIVTKKFFDVETLIYDPRN